MMRDLKFNYTFKQKSVANRSSAIDVTDFTNGSWKTNKPVDILLEQEEITKVKL